MLKQVKYVYLKSILMYIDDHYLLKEKLTYENKSEELRMLYVAMTHKHGG